MQEMRGTEILPHGEVAGDGEVREVRGGGRGENPFPGGDEVGGRQWEGVAPILSNSPIANESITGFGLPIVPAPVQLCLFLTASLMERAIISFPASTRCKLSPNTVPHSNSRPAHRIH